MTASQFLIAQKISIRPAWSIGFLYVATVIAFWMSWSERTGAIIAFALLAQITGVFICMLFRRDRDRALTLFAAGYLARAAAGTLNWISEQHGGAWIAHFATDGQGYFESSHLPIPSNFSPVNSPGWLVYNRVATLVGDLLGGAHPLANLQVQLLAGALIAPILYALAKRLGLPRTGLWAAWIVALHPMFIAYSAALIRDETISMLGFAVLLLVVDAVALRRTSAGRWLLVTAGILLLTSLRGVSAFYFVAAAGIFILAVKRPTRQKSRLFLSVAFLVLLGLGLGVGYFSNLGFFLQSRRFKNQIELRGEAHEDASSIVETSLVSGGFTWIPALFALHFVAPFPFFRAFLGTEVSFLHYALGMGALLNQLLLVFFVAGALFAITRGSRAIIACFVIVIGLAAVSTLMFGDPARYMTAHAGPLVVLLGVYGFRRLDGIKAIVTLSWATLLVGVHIAYFMVKARYGG